MATTPGQTVLATGRIVWGHPFKGTPKVDDNNQPVIDAETGTQILEFGFGLAIPKSQFTEQNMVPGGSAEIWKVMHEQAYLAFGNQQPPANFSWKYKDGDTVDHNGKPFADRPGYKDHLVFALSTRIPFEVVKYNEQIQKYYPVNEGVKCGDYVQVQVSIKAHAGNPQKRGSKGGVYFNPLAVLFLGYGEEIITGPSAEQRFGNRPPAMPQGASATPLAPMNSPLGAAPQAQGMPQVSQGMGMPQVNQGMPAQMPQAQQYQQPAATMPAPVHHQQADPNYAVIPQHLHPQAPPQMPQATQQYQQPVAPAQGMPMPGGFPMPGAR